MLPAGGLGCRTGACWAARGSDATGAACPCPAKALDAWGAVPLLLGPAAPAAAAGTTCRRAGGDDCCGRPASDPGCWPLAAAPWA